MSSSPHPSFTRAWHNGPQPATSPTLPALSLKGKLVVITGGGSGLGSSIAHAFSLAGASVAIIGRTEKTLQSTKSAIQSSVPGSDVLIVNSDVTDKVSIDNAFAAISAHFGKSTDVFVSNAGYLSLPSPVASADPEDWWHGFEINVKGAFLATQAFLKHGAPSSDAVVVNVTAGIAHVPAIPTLSGYGSSKFAGMKFFDSVGAENPDMRVMHLHPGVVETDMTAKVGMKGQDDAMLPANFLVWLASSEATFLKGKCVWANWDVEEMKARAEEIEISDVLTLNLEGWPFKG